MGGKRPAEYRTGPTIETSFTPTGRATEAERAAIRRALDTARADAAKEAALADDAEDWTGGGDHAA